MYVQMDGLHALAGEHEGLKLKITMSDIIPKYQTLPTLQRECPVRWF